MTERILLSKKSLQEFSPKEFKEHVVGLYQKPETRGSESVEGVGITFGPRTIIRVKRDPKYVTEKEIRLLSAEYGKEFEDLLALFKDKKRKIEVRV